MAEPSVPDFPPVVDPGWVGEHLGRCCILDVRWYLDGRSGYDAYLAGHVPGARWVDLDRWLADPPGLKKKKIKEVRREK
jgi:thiosulfate/3-mercaptopyruvate sulfurtransferase